MAHASQQPPGGNFKLTYDDYAALPADGKRYQILDGGLDVTRAPTPRHQDVSFNLGVLLRSHITAHDLGKLYLAPIDVILDRINVVQPDLVFVAKERVAIVSKRAIEGAPELVVEILSPGTAEVDRVAKSKIYATHHVMHYWIVDPEACTLEAYELQGDYVEIYRGGEQDVFAPALFDGLRVPLVEVFR